MTIGRFLRLTVAHGAALAVPVAAFGADLTVGIGGVRSDRGAVLVAVCPAEAFLSARCPYSAAASARAGTTEVTVEDLPAGTYAIQAFHDENGNRELDRTAFGWPREGLGFSRDAPMRFGPPRFDDASFSLPEVGGRLALSLRYF